MAATVASGVSHSGYTLTVNKPNGTAEGDLLVAFITVDADNATLGSPAGWVDQGGVTGYDKTVRVFTKIAAGSEPGSYTFTCSSTNTFRSTMVRVDGAPTSNFIAQGLAWTGVNGSATTFTMPTRTAPTGGALQLGFLVTKSSAIPTINLASGWTSPCSLTNTESNAIIASRTVPAGTTSASQFSVSNQGTQYNHTIGTLLVSSGQVVSISRAIAPSRSLSRGVLKILTASITPARSRTLQRVVVRVFSRSIGGTGTTDDNFTDDFSDSFIVSGGTPSALSATLVKVPNKVLSRTILPYGGYAKVTQKVLTASIAITGFSRRTLIRVFRATITPSSSFTNANIGRLFGAPGVVDITVRLAGEIRARVRRR